MTNTLKNRYHPEQISPPGETLQEILEERGMTQTQLAERMGRPKKTISEIINGKASITSETALQLEHVLGVPARFWNNREQHYREYLSALEEREHLKGQTDWLKNFPLKEMRKYGWLPTHTDTVEQLRTVLNFLGIASPSILQNNAAFRKANDSNPYAVAAWLRKGEIEGQLTSCASYNEQKFKAVLGQIRPLTVNSLEVFEPELKRLCASAGVAVAIVRELPKTKVCGAVRWLTPTKALLQLSFRHKTTDQFWFTFFHEAAHILKHSKKGDFLDFEHREESQDEDEANLFSAETLIPPTALRKFLAFGKPTEESVTAFAKVIGIEPGIIVGRLQHDYIIPFNRFNNLKTCLHWENI